MSKWGGKTIRSKNYVPDGTPCQPYSSTLAMLMPLAKMDQNGSVPPGLQQSLAYRQGKILHHPKPDWWDRTESFTIGGSGLPHISALDSKEGTTVSEDKIQYPRFLSIR